MSSEQLGKLNIMVEKLLETASLDSDNLNLNLASIDLIDTINTLTRRFKIQFPERQFVTNFNTESYLASVDPFHFENALNNILDNAIKYGGKKITVDLRPKNKHFEILISDTGTTLTKAYKERIFDKFYRVPKGNTHDVKGFGIGLYYTKSIIEKHHGTIDLELKEKLTTFKITLPNGS
ncbi:ATP-binding protein [Winogradskyella sp.]|nr:ATP-binding protein [Winogradskyella sp.]